MKSHVRDESLRRGPRGNESGYVLAASVLILAAVMVVGASFFALAHYEIRSTEASLESQQAFWLAEGGGERALRWMEKQNRPPDYDTWIYRGEAGPDQGDYDVKVWVDPGALWKPNKEFVLEATGRVNGIERHLRKRIRLESFAKYAYFTDSEQGQPGNYTIWFVTQDVIEGPTHSNNTFHIYGSPTFLGEVTSASDRMIGNKTYVITDETDWPAGSNNPTFAKGMELDHANIPLPTSTGDLKSGAKTGGLFVAVPSEVQLGRTGTTAGGTLAPGWLRHKPIGAPDSSWVDVSLALMPTKVVYVDGEVRLDGILDGELTVASSDNVYIVDDVVYACSNGAGTPSGGCDDLLGIVAERNILFADNAPATNDLKVNSVLMALNTSITAEKYNQGAPRGKLTIWGGLIQKFRGPVGTTSGTSIVSGYEKNYHYDPRVTARTPPLFPLKGTYEEISWVETIDQTPPF